jgi:hypothetical protein
MRIGRLLILLRNCKRDPSPPVLFDFCRCFPTTVQSWRGVYAEAALGWTNHDFDYDAKETTVDDLIAELEKAIDGRKFTGWKGGEFSYNEDTEIHVDNPGECTHTEIINVEDKGYVVLLHTRNNDN